MFHATFVQIRIFDWLSGRQKGSIFVKMFKNLLRNHNSTANIKAVRGSLWWLSVNKLSHIPELQSVSAVYENQ